MDAYIKSPNTKRFVIENSITKVTSDGEPHELMTMVAVLSGLLAAIIILAIVVSMITCRNSKTDNKNSEAKTPAAMEPTSLAVITNFSYKADAGNDDYDDEVYKKTTSTLTLPKTAMLVSGSDAAVNSGDDSDAGNIKTPRLAGNLKVAFVEGKENNFCGNKYRTPNWQEAVAAEGQTRETYIQVERY